MSSATQPTGTQPTGGHKHGALRRGSAACGLLVGVALLITGCVNGSPGPIAKTSTMPSASASPSATSSPPTPSTSLVFLAIVEPFDTPFACKKDGNTQEMASCFLLATKNVDAQIDGLQSARFAASTTDTTRQAILDNNQAWLAQRHVTCLAQANSGGSIDQINGAACIFTESKKRLALLQANSTVSSPPSASHTP